MNKMAKGAIATAAGVVLLVGGGGTLAVWNVEQNANAGKIASGNMQLTAGDGVWTVNGDTVEAADLSSYLIVPGDELTYAQEVTATLVGENLEADLTLANEDGINDGFLADTYETSPVTLTTADEEPLETLTEGETTVTAEVTFTFNTSAQGQESANATYDFSGVAFMLDQVDPTTTP